MSAFEIIDNLNKINYIFNQKNKDKYDDYELVEEKYNEIVKQIFKSPSYEDKKKYGHWIKAFQEINKDILNYIIKKYNINKDFIDNFYMKSCCDVESYHASNNYIYLFIKDDFGDLLINKYTMAHFIILIEIVENILKANFKWYKKALESEIPNLVDLECFDIFKHGMETLAGIMDFIFIKHFNIHRRFRKNYVIRRIDCMTDYDFEDRTQYKDSWVEYNNYNGNLLYTFSDFCSDNCLPWSEYYDYAVLYDGKHKKRIIDNDYLEYYETVKTTYFEHPIFYEFNINDNELVDDKENSDSETDNDKKC